jgi:hypothetical protein
MVSFAPYKRHCRQRHSPIAVHTQIPHEREFTKPSPS